MTSDGLRWLWEARVKALEGAFVRVGDGTQFSEAKVASVELVQSQNPDGSQGISAVLKTTFPGDDANFEWTQRDVFVGKVKIDAVKEDMGRKAPGAAWDVAVLLHLIEGQ